MVAENLAQVRKNINESCNKINRDPNEVTLIAVSKTKPVEMLKEAYDAGARVFGENKVQEIVDKYDQMPSDVKWHMIGHLQRNKVKYIVDKVAMIHSVDSLRLAETIEKEAAKKAVIVPIEDNGIFKPVTLFVTSSISRNRSDAYRISPLLKSILPYLAPSISMIEKSPVCVRSSFRNLTRIDVRSFRLAACFSLKGIKRLQRSSVMIV